MNTPNVVQNRSNVWSPEVIFPVMPGCKTSGSTTTTSCQQERTELRQKVVDLTFLGVFGREVGASLELNAVLDTAARLLYAHFRFDWIEIILSPSYGGKHVLYNALDERGTIPRNSSWSGKPSEVRGFRDLGLSRPKIKRAPGADLRIPLTAGAGLLVLSSAGQVNRGKDDFLDCIGEMLFVAVNNAIEHGVVKERSLRDSLTGLFNRRVLEEMLAMEVGRREPVPLALLVLDLDNFKQVNDSFGHPAGDTVLTTFSSILRECCRPTDIVTRYGGEEFAVFLSGVSCAAALGLAERLRGKMAGQLFSFAGKEIRITTSVGMAFNDNGGVSADEFLSRADQALYHAKHNGKNRVSLFGGGGAGTGKRNKLRLCGKGPQEQLPAMAA